MNIILKSDPVTTNQQPNVEFVLSDKGSAFVKLTLVIDDKYTFSYEEQYTGSLTRSLLLKKGSYPCTFLIQAHRPGALGPVYNSFLKISGNDVVTAEGTLEGDFDADGTGFTLNVV